MERFTIPLNDYNKALTSTKDEAYLTHLKNDFVITQDGLVVPRVNYGKAQGVAEQKPSTYSIALRGMRNARG